jgi:4-amino-4-deoxy-L-arabinose transferase-like glycosyltransferase
MTLTWPTSAGWRLGLIVGLAGLVWLPGHARRDLWEPDEARYAYIAREMQQDGHVAVLYRSGELYAHKPPLMFWAMRVSSLLTGGSVNRVAARLPSLLGVIMTLWAVTSIARLWDGPRTAVRAGLIAATTYLVWNQANWGQIDMLLCGCELMGLWLLLAGDRTPHGLRSLGAFVFFGLAVLAKGPVGFLVPCGAYLSMHAVARDWRPVARLHWVWGLLVVAAFPAVWLLMAWHEGAPPAYFHELLFKQNVQRAAGELGHVRPWYYFAQYLVLDGLPWSLLAPAAYSILRRDAATRTWRRQALAWMAFVVIFFSIPASKRNLYILMAYPALSIVVAGAWTRAEGQRSRLACAGIGLLAILLLAPAIAIAVLRWRESMPVEVWMLLPPAGVGVGGVWLLVRAYRRGGLADAFFGKAAAIFLALFWWAGTVVLPALNDEKTPREILPLVEAYIPVGETLLLHRMHGENLPFYAHRRGEVHWNDDTLWRAVQSRAHGVVVFSADRWSEQAARYAHIATARVPFDTGSKNLVAIGFGSPMR